MSQLNRVVNIFVLLPTPKEQKATIIIKPVYRIILVMVPAFRNKKVIQVDTSCTYSTFSDDEETATLKQTDKQTAENEITHSLT